MVASAGCYAFFMDRKSRSDLWPILHYEDTNRALAFFVDALGFTSDSVVRDEVGQVVHAEMGLPNGGTVVFGSASRGGGVHNALPVGGSACYIISDQVDSAFERAESAGADIIQKPHETAFGTGTPTRAFTARDPEGNLWTFGDYNGPVAG